MVKIASERLLDRAKLVRAGSIGVSVDDIARIPLDEKMIGDTMECLATNDVAELKWGLLFALGILSCNPPQSFLTWLKPRVLIWLKHNDWDVRQRTLDIFIRLRNNYKNYREVMLDMLRDREATVRSHVLKEYRTFLTKKDIPVLLCFQNDRYMTETEMGSPLVYAIRNEALAVIEILCGKLFTKSELVESGEAGRMVYWWDWQPFLTGGRTIKIVNGDFGKN